MRISLIRNVLSNWTCTVATIVYSIAVTPIVTRALQREQYGIWSFLNGITAYSNLFYMGLGAALVRYTAEHFANGDRQALNRLVSTVTAIYALLGLLCFGAMAGLAPYVPKLLHCDSNTLLSQATVIAATLLGVSLFQLFLGSVFSGVLVAEGRMDVRNSVQLCATAVRFVAVPIVVAFPNPLVALSIAIVAIGSGQTLGLAILAHRFDRKLKIRFSIPRMPELRLLYGFGVFAFLMQLSQRIISYTDTTVIGIVLGAEAVALYALPLQLTQYARTAVYGIVSILLPHLTHLRATQGKRRVADAYIATLRVTAVVSAFLSVNIIFLGTPFLRRWVGSEYAVHANQILLFLGIAVLFQSISTQCQIPFCQALNVVRFPTFVLLIEASLNLLLSVALIRRFGIEGVALATVIPAVFVSFILIPPYVCRTLKLSLKRVCLSALSPSVAVVAIVCVCHVATNQWFDSASYLNMGAKVCISAGGVLVALPLVASTNEKRMVLRLAGVVKEIGA